MDGAHNPQKMKALVMSLQAKFPDQKFDILIGMLSCKDLEETLKVMKPIVKTLTATEFRAEQDMPRGSIDATKIVHTAKKFGFQEVDKIGSPVQAFEKLVEKNNTPVLVTGSFFLLNYIRPLIFKA